MTERIPKVVLFGGAILVPLFLVYLAYSRPGYFTSQTYLGGLLVFELLFAATWAYRRVFFPLVLVAFLFAGTNLPVGSFWTALRWVFLGTGALVGAAIMLKDHWHPVRLFHVLATFAILAALVSAAVSRYPNMALLKAASLMLLFAYAGTGARLAVTGREVRFFRGLLLGCEVFVGAVGFFSLIGVDAMGNPNSLGAAMGVVGAPILLWGTMLPERRFVHQRRLVLFLMSMYLVFQSHSRAGMIAAFFACGLLCLVLRKFKLLGQGVVIILILLTASAIFYPERLSKAFSSFTSSVVYKGKDPALGVFSSRQSPWQAAVDTLQTHFWFGTGFGTTDNGQDASANLNPFASQGMAAENGSSYLAIITWVGMAGVLPFSFMLLVLLGKVLRSLIWTLNTGSPSHPAVPLAVVMIAGLLHAAFEDWLFAPGYYLCMFFWSMAFILVDLAPSASLPRFAFASRSRPIPHGLGSVVPGR